MSLVERLKKILATEEEEDTPEGASETCSAELTKDVEKKEGEEVEKVAKAVNTQSGSEGDKPKLVRKQITLGARPINIDLSKEVERFNE